MSDFAVSVKLTYREFCAIDCQLQQNLEQVQHLRHLSPSSDVELAEWYLHGFAKRIYYVYRSNKQLNFKHSLKVPTSIAIVLWQKMQHNLLTNEQQTLLSQLDQQLTNIDFKPQMQ